MESILYKILQKENTIILPDFGALLKIGDGYQFNRFLKYDDGKFSDFIEKEYSIEKEKAKEEITLFVKKIKDELASSGTFNIPEIGTLKLNGENISVVRDKTTKVSNLGDIQSVVKQKEKPSVTLKEEIKKTSKTKDSEVPLPPKEIEQKNNIKPNKELINKKIDNQESKINSDKSFTKTISSVDTKIEEKEKVNKQTKVTKKKEILESKPSTIKSNTIKNKDNEVKEKLNSTSKENNVDSKSDNLKDVSFFDLLRDKKGEKFTPLATNKLPESEKQSKVLSTENKSNAKLIKGEIKSDSSANAKKIKSSSNSSLKDVSFFDLLRDKKGEKFVPVSPKKETAPIKSDKITEVKDNSSKENKAVLPSPSLVNETTSVVKTDTKPSSKVISENVAVSSAPIIVEKDKRKKRIPVFLIIIILLFLLLGGFGYFFRDKVSNYYLSAKTYIAGNSNQSNDQSLTPDGKKKSEKNSSVIEGQDDKNENNTSVNEDEIVSAEEEYVGDSKVEGEEGSNTEANTLNSEVNEDSESSVNQPADLDSDSEDNEVEMQVNNNSELAEEKEKESKSNNDSDKEIEETISTTTSTDNLATTSSGRYKLITGSYSEKDNAKRKVRQLIDSGYSNAYLLSSRYGGYYIVSLNDFETKEEAEEMIEKFKSSGESCFIKKI